MPCEIHNGKSELKNYGTDKVVIVVSLLGRHFMSKLFMAPIEGPNVKIL